jgi:hypothetical protein
LGAHVDGTAARKLDAVCPAVDGRDVPVYNHPPDRLRADCSAPDTDPDSRAAEKNLNTFAGRITL